MNEKDDVRRLLTKTQLRAERLKPAPGQGPVTRYWQGMGWVDLYDAALAVAMRPYRVPSPAQLAVLAAGRKLTGTVLCGGCGARVSRDELTRRLCGDCLEAEHRAAQANAWSMACFDAGHLLALDPLFLDTETTGLDASAEIVEIAVLDKAGAVLLDTLVQPVRPMRDDARAVNGITDAELASAPTWAASDARVKALLAGRLVVAHNADFDRRMLAQTCGLHALSVPEAGGWACTLELLMEPNGGRWPSLGDAMWLAGAERPDNVCGRPHRAAFDAECCRRIVVALAAQRDDRSVAGAADARCRD